METSNPLIGKTILKIEISDDKETITFFCEDAYVVGECYADCCSSTWIENVEYPALGYPAKVLNVEDLGLTRAEEEHPEHDYLQVYGYKISTDKGDLVIDFRNSSNGYYGGSLDWSVQTPKEPSMSTTEQEAPKEITGEGIRKIADATNTQPLLFNAEGNATPYYKSLSRAERLGMWHTQPHPKFTAAQVKSNALKAKRADQKSRLKTVTELGDFRFLVFGRLTVCYRRAKNVVYISTALRNPKDVDDPLSAKLGAAYRMTQSQYIVAPIHSKNSAKYAVKSMFFFSEVYDN
jgi:hypothetical protein